MKQQTLDEKQNWTPPTNLWNAMFLSIFFTNIALNLGQQMSNSLCGWVASVFGYTPAMWLVMTAPILCGVVFILIFRKNITRIEEDFQKRSAAA